MKHTLKKLRLNFCFVILFCVALADATAQGSKPFTKIYFQAGAGAGTYESANYDLGVKAVFNNKWSMTLSYKGMEMTPKNQPSDYEPEVGYILIIPYTYETTANLNLVSLTAGKYFSLGKNFFATTEGGLSYVSGDKVNYQRTQQVSSSIIFAGSTSSNYNTTKESKSGLGVMLQADLNWAFASFMGLGAEVYANINSIQSPVGFQLTLLVGKMGRAKKH